jgi:hypothetical protein
MHMHKTRRNLVICNHSMLDYEWLNVAYDYEWFLLWSWSNACSWKICYACGGRDEGGYLNEMGRIWSLSRFRHTLCWHEKGIMRLWRSMDILVVVTALTPWSSYFISSCKERLLRWTSEGRQDRWRFTSMIWIFQGQAFHWGDACPYGFWSSFQLITTMTYSIFPIDWF